MAKNMQLKWKLQNPRHFQVNTITTHATFRNNTNSKPNTLRTRTNKLRAHELANWHEYGGVLLLGYTMFRNLLTAKTLEKKEAETFRCALVDPGPNLVICDEGHLLKNQRTTLNATLKSMKTMRRIVLTGTWACFIECI